MANHPAPLGIGTHRHQFMLLFLVNAFVGAMLGLERTLVPQIAKKDFNLASVSVVLAFIISFGIVKALANLYAGRKADQWGRKRLLMAGWLIGLPVPIIIILAPSWGWIVFANMLLGINQGFCWSSAVIMKIDLAGPAQRGMAVGLNEFAGYAAMALATIGSGWLASATALRPYPFFLGIGFAVAGLVLSHFFIRETVAFARHETSKQLPTNALPTFGEIFQQMSWRDKRLASLVQAGLVNNLNDVVIWGILPLLALEKDLPLGQAAVIGSLYLAVWGISQLGAGALSDHWGRKPLISLGLFTQAIGITIFAVASSYGVWLMSAFVMGLGTGMVYPTLLAAVGDSVPSWWRATALGVYRLWRDFGYALGAVVAGLLADFVGLQFAIIVIAIITAWAGIRIVWVFHAIPKTAIIPQSVTSHL